MHLQEQRDTGSKAPARPAAAPLEAFWSTVVDGDLVRHRPAMLRFRMWMHAIPERCLCHVALQCVSRAGAALRSQPETPSLPAALQPQVASSHERKYLAFTLFQLLLPHLG